MGERFAAGLRGIPAIGEVRGRGLMIACEVDRPAGDVVKAVLARGLLIGTAGNGALRLTPPLTISADEVDEAVCLLAEALA